MKKLLLGSTALAAAGLFSASALAADPIKVTVGGYYQWYFVVGGWDKDNAGRDGRADSIRQEGEIHFNGITKLDNGTNIGFRVELEVYTTGDQVDEPAGRQALYQREPLFASSEDAYGETGLQTLLETSRIEYNIGRDLTAPLVLGVTVRRTGESQLDAAPRLVLIGDSDLVSNQFVQSLPGNVWFWTDLVDWLTGYVESVSFTPITDPTLLNLVLSDQQRSTIAVITMVILPCAVLALGGAVWWYRRR